MMDYLIELLYLLPAAVIAIVLHELAHSLVSYAFGDPTPKNEGRLTLNPLKHIDPIGFLLLIVARVGWAKPVMIDPRYYKKPKLAIAIVSLAGPLINIILALIFSLIYVILYKVGFENSFIAIIGQFSLICIYLNIGLALFNLIPIPPLDGSKILGAFLPDKIYIKYMSYQKYGMIFMLIIFLVITILDHLGYPSLINYIVNNIAYAFLDLWAMIIL